MTELERVKALTPKFQLTVLLGVNGIDTMITEMIGVDFCKEADDIYKRVDFFNYFINSTINLKIDLLKIILKNNHPEILAKFPNYFADLEEIQQMRNSIAHNTVAYERDSSTGENASLILHHPRIKRQKKLREKQMLEVIKKTEKVSEETRKLWILIGKTKGLKFG
jgi:hypothetical protein